MIRPMNIDQEIAKTYTELKNLNLFMTIKMGSTFGEWSLIYKTKRGATIYCKSEVVYLAVMKK